MAAFGGGYADVSGGGFPLVFTGEASELEIGAVLGDPFGGAVGRGRVDYDDFELVGRQGLKFVFPQHFLECAELVVGAEYNADLWMCAHLEEIRVW